jgi:prefoldin subunit 5
MDVNSLSPQQLDTLRQNLEQVTHTHHSLHTTTQRLLLLHLHRSSRVRVTDLLEHQPYALDRSRGVVSPYPCGTGVVVYPSKCGGEASAPTDRSLGQPPSYPTTTVTPVRSLELCVWLVCGWAWQEIGYLTNSLQQLKVAQEKFSLSVLSLDSLTPENDGKQVLVPLSGTLYAPGNLAVGGKVLVDVGTGYYLEKVGG